ncbi:MAG: peroxiredoxin family protein, partial [Phycisphaerales bacterium]
MADSKRLSGKAVIVGFFLLVAVVGGGLWLALDAARDTFVANSSVADFGSADVQFADRWLRVNLDTGDGGPLPFYLQIPAAGDEAIIRNGDEEVAADLQRFEDGAYLLDFPHYDSRLTLEPEGEALVGVYTKTRGGGAIAEMPAEARPVGEPLPAQRFPFVTAAPVNDRSDFSGEWRMNFADGGLAKGVFEQDESGALTGTILTPTGDYRFLAGNVVAETMNLSVFDGSHAFLFTGELGPSTDAMTGHFYSGGYYHDTFTATRLSPGEDFELPDPFSEVSLVSGETRLGLEALQREPYAGKPTIVVVFGTWCPNCNDEAPLLKRLYDEHHAAGLQILGLAYEHTDDAERSRLQVERFKERHAIDWEILIGGVSDKQQTAATLPALSTIKSYPTTIWVNPDGTV